MSVYLVNIRAVEDDASTTIVHVACPDKASADGLVSDLLSDLADPNDIAVAVVDDDWECAAHDEANLRCGMPRLN